jgi:hypothetical protein
MPRTSAGGGHYADLKTFFNGTMRTQHPGVTHYLIHAYDQTNSSSDEGALRVRHAKEL